MSISISGWITKKFEKKPTEVDGALETWIVEWRSISHDVGRFWKSNLNQQAFSNEDSAHKYCKELNDARKLLGDRHLTPRVYKQKQFSNA